MKKGDEQMINGQAELVANLDASIKSMTRSQQHLDIFALKVQDARAKQNIGAGMVAVSKALGRVTKTIELARVRSDHTTLWDGSIILTWFHQIEQVMEDLENQYEDIDVMTSVLNSATGQSTARDVPQEEIDRIKRMVADQAGLELSQELNSASVDVNAIKTAPIKTGPTAEEEDAIADRLKALRQTA